MSSQPKRYRVYTIVEKANGGPFWLKLGNAIEHRDGRGVSLVLPAIPISGALILRQIEDDQNGVSIDTEGHERQPELAMET